MLNTLLNQLFFDLLPYFTLALLVMVEGPIATLMGGAAASSGLLMPLPVYVSVVLGNLTADLGWYGLGRAHTLEWFQRLGPRLGVDLRCVKLLEQKVYAHAARMVFLAKLTVGFPIPTLVATGLCRVPVRRWVGMLVFGELLKSAGLVTVGYLYAHAVQQASSGVQIVLWGITAVACIGGVITYRRHRKA